MKIIKIAIITVLLATTSNSCSWFLKPHTCSDSGPVVVYKTKKDYKNNITVLLSEDGQKIVGLPEKSTVLSRKPIELANGYLLKRISGNAYLSITIDEYADTNSNWESQDLLNYLIDKDPYSEIYECCECTGGDTALINILIRENNLGECEDIK